jgi:hypothetical protein
MCLINARKFVTISTLLLSLVSCGKKDSSSSNDRQEQKDTITSINWKIYLQGRSFPKARVEINNALLLDECLGKQQYTIDRLSDPQSIALIDYFVPREGALKIVITDLGNECESVSDDSVFFAQDNVPFDFLKIGRSTEVLVNL